MSSSSRAKSLTNGPVEFLRRPRLNKTALIVSWTVDTAGLSESVTSYLNRKLSAQPFCRIDPGEFYQLEGVNIRDAVVQFPEATFYVGPKKNVVVFRSAPPRFDWYRFLNLALDVASDYCHVSELYAIGGMVSLVPHAAPRELLGNFSTPEMRESMSSQNMSVNWNYETPAGQRPTLNSFLLWAAKNRGIPAATLWVPVPFYLAASGDPMAQLRVLEFFNRKFDLCLSFDDLDEEVRRQNRAITRARKESPEIDGYISKIERGETLSDEDSQKLVSLIEKELISRR